MGKNVDELIHTNIHAFTTNVPETYLLYSILFVNSES